jgi:hypothetical protein
MDECLCLAWFIEVIDLRVDLTQIRVESALRRIVKKEIYRDRKLPLLIILRVSKEESSAWRSRGF